MKQEANEQLISSSIVYCAVILFLYFILNALIRFIFGGGDNSVLTVFYADGVLRILFSIPCIILLGEIMRGNGFKFSFGTKGLKKGLFAHAFFLLNMSLHLPLIFITTEINMEFIPMIPAIIFNDLATGIFEEILMRGLFMTAMLVQFGGTAKGRIFCVLLNGLVFGLLHLIGGDLLAVLFTGILGIGFAAAYVYSKNLLSCIIFHALWNIVFKISGGLVAGVDNEGLLAVLQIVACISILAILLFGIILTIKSKPHFKAAEPDMAKNI
jgi:membrane protease YdiL (CAAX protease family)